MNKHRLDANAFIEAKTRHYGMAFCPGFGDWLVAGHGSGTVFGIKAVSDELAQNRRHETRTHSSRVRFGAVCGRLLGALYGDDTCSSDRFGPAWGVASGRSGRRRSGRQPPGVRCLA